MVHNHPSGDPTPSPEDIGVTERIVEDAAAVGTARVAGAIAASTLTTCVVFLPVLFIREEAGQLYSDVAIAISASILASMLVAIMLIPTASARLVPNIA